MLNNITFAGFEIFNMCFHKKIVDFVVTHVNLEMWIGLGFDANGNVG